MIQSGLYIHMDENEEIETWYNIDDATYEQIAMMITALELIKLKLLMHCEKLGEEEDSTVL